MKDNEFTKEFAELYAGKNFMYMEKYRVCLVGYNEGTGLLIVSGHPKGWSVFNRHDGDVLLIWTKVIHDLLYYVKPDDLSPYAGKNKEFAEEHAGEYFLFENKTRVQVVGYRDDSFKSVLVYLPDHVRTIGWGRESLDTGDVFTFLPRADRFWCVDIDQLK